MDWVRLLLRRGGVRDHAPVFQDFRRVIAAVLATTRGRTSPRIVDPFDWMNR